MPSCSTPAAPATAGISPIDATDTAPVDAPLNLDQVEVPRATYRLQMHAGFTLDDATAIVDYLAALGVSHVYTSPLLKARAGSTHGYDVVDHNRLNPEIGDAAAFDRFCAALRKAGLGHVIDIVPNHMGVLGADNPWWHDVLEHGQASAYAGHFDIDWNPPDEALRGRVMIPVLGDQYGDVLDRGELKLAFDAADGTFGIAYFEHRFPLDPREYAQVLTHAVALAGTPSSPSGIDGAQTDRNTAAADDVAAPAGADANGASAGLTATQRALLAIRDVFEGLPDRSPGADSARGDRAAQARAARGALVRLVAADDVARQAIDRAVDRFNEPAGIDWLDTLIEAQAWRPTYWGMAADEVNYRRFFDVDALAALHAQKPQVFADTHRTVLQWLAEGRVQGLRVDHPDGLRDPAAYFERLQRACVATPRADGSPPGPAWLVIEKIVAGFERLRPGWPVHGATGYKFANLVNGLFVDPSAATRLDRVYHGFTGATDPFADVVHDGKVLIMTHVLASEIGKLVSMLHPITQRDRHTRDFTKNRLGTALIEIIAAFPVYRSYLDGGPVDPLDRQIVDWAVATARRRSPAGENTVLEYIRRVLLDTSSLPDARSRSLARDFIARFQQVTSPITAKGIEDTALYRYNRLLSLNEVGGDPAHFGVSPAQWHGESAHRRRHHPHEMIASSTHDSKRGEDARLRIDVLSEMPATWRLALRRWSRLNERWRTETAHGMAPSRNDEYAIYQSLIGSFPDLGPASRTDGEAEPFDQAALDAFRERFHRWALKAVREAKRHTSWISPDEAYESAVASFIDGLLGVLAPNPFLTDFRALHQRICAVARPHGLGAAVLRLTAPGVPDIYQGCEQWNESLVDPDNRRAVDFASRAAVLREIRRLDARSTAPWLADALARAHDGRIKQYVTAQCLQLRRDMPSLFSHGAYQPVTIDGERSEHVIAFRRTHDGDECLVVVGRLLWIASGNDEARIGTRDVWNGTTLVLPDGTADRWRNVLDGRTHAARPPAGRDGARDMAGADADSTPRLALSDVFEAMPVAVLVPDRPRP